MGKEWLDTVALLSRQHCRHALDTLTAHYQTVSCNYRPANGLRMAVCHMCAALCVALGRAAGQPMAKRRVPWGEPREGLYTMTLRHFREKMLAIMSADGIL